MSYSRSYTLFSKDSRMTTRNLYVKEFVHDIVYTLSQVFIFRKIFYDVNMPFPGCPTKCHFIGRKQNFEIMKYLTGFSWGEGVKIPVNNF